MRTTAYTLTRAGQLPALTALLERHLAEGQELRLVVGPRPSRSREQLAFLHVAVRALAEHTGTRESDLKEYFKGEYGPSVQVKVGTVETNVPKSWGDYSVQEASEMLEHVIRTAAECGLLIQAEGNNGL